MRKYDTTFIIGGSLSVEERESLIEKFKSALEKIGGKVDRIVRWGMRTLAYQIKKSSQGYYVIFYYEADPLTIKTFERELRINENVLRYMTLVFDGKHPEYIPDEEIRRSGVSHSEPVVSAAAATEDVSSVEEVIEEDYDINEEDEDVEEDLGEENETEEKEGEK